MNQEGIFYISNNLAKLLGIPVRVYLHDRPLKSFSSEYLFKDPFLLHEFILQMNPGKNLFYHYTDDSYYYCVLASEMYKIIVGPFRYFAIDRQSIDKMIFQLGISKEEKDRFSSAISSITPMPLETVIQSLCSYSYVLNGEMMTIEDIMIKDDLQRATTKALLEEHVEGGNITQERNSTLQIEETLIRFVEEGNLEGFKEWVKTAPSIRAGAMSSDYLRQHKNTFIIAVTLFSRAAMKGGLAYSEALDLSDEYIRKVEQCRAYKDISNLNYSMVIDFIERVARIKSNHSPLKTKIAMYAYNHMSELISLDDLAAHLYMSKSNLCLRFKKETGATVSHFILEKKIDYSKSLLKNSNKPLSSIALYLGFSSQAHFSKVFKELTGTSPYHFRNLGIAVK